MKYVPYTAAGCLMLALGWLGWKQHELTGELALLRQRQQSSASAPRQASASEVEDLRGRFERMRIDLNAGLHGISQTSGKLETMQKSFETLNRQVQALVEARRTNVASGPALAADRKPMLPNMTNSPAELVQVKPKPKRTLVKRRWGPEQAAGAPDTLEAGDNASAWAPREPHSGIQWLQLEYERAVELSEIKIRETFNPGAVCKITALDANGKEVKIWEGVEPTAQAPVEVAFRASCRTQADRVRIYLDTNRVRGWNEIDAVELVARDGTRQWAIDASASSSYADP